MNKKLVGHLALIILTLCLTSCDRVANIHVQVINSLSNPILVTFIDNEHLTDTLQTIVINSSDTVIILKTISGVLGRNEEPRDVYLDTDTFDMFKRFQISIDNIVLKKDYHLSKEWTYNVVDKNLGVYELKVNNADINKN